MKTVQFWLVVALLSLCNLPSGRAEERVVASLGSRPRMDIRGAESFQSDEIRLRLLADLDVANACYPTTPVDELCRLLDFKTREAYLYAGFADLRIETAPNAAGDRLEMVIVAHARVVQWIDTGIPVKPAFILNEAAFGPCATGAMPARAPIAIEIRRAYHRELFNGIESNLTVVPQPA